MQKRKPIYSSNSKKRPNSKRLSTVRRCSGASKRARSTRSKSSWKRRSSRWKSGKQPRRIWSYPIWRLWMRLIREAPRRHLKSASQRRLSSSETNLMMDQKYLSVVVLEAHLWLLAIRQKKTEQWMSWRSCSLMNTLNHQRAQPRASRTAWTILRRIPHNAAQTRAKTKGLKLMQKYFSKSWMNFTRLRISLSPKWEPAPWTVRNKCQRENLQLTQTRRYSPKSTTW